MKTAIIATFFVAHTSHHPHPAVVDTKTRLVVFAVCTIEAFEKPAACDICQRILTKVIRDCITNGHHDPETIERYIQIECRADPGLSQSWEKDACIADLSLAIPVIERDFSNNASSSADRVCHDIRVCH